MRFTLIAFTNLRFISIEVGWLFIKFALFEKV